MPDMKQLEINGVVYDVRDPTKAPVINIGSYTGDLHDISALPVNSVAWINPNNVTNSPSANYANLETFGSSNGNRVQRLNTVSGPTAVSSYVNSAWSEWEWVNPPLSTGTEYRTTERWNGKAVYTVLVNCGTAAAGENNVPTNFVCSNIIGSRGFVGSGAIPQSYESARNDKYFINCNVVKKDGKIDITLILGSLLSATSPCYVQVWYTKE